MLALTRKDLDITDQAAVRSCVAAERPSLLVNCAVIQVDEAEQKLILATLEAAGKITPKLRQ